MLGHHRLWIGGVEHNDISVKNLMYDKHNEYRGILNDYDLAHLDGRPRPSGLGRTGTMPFMAIDMLTKEAWAGKITRLYRHDCKSFAWVLLWICCRYDGGKEIPNPPLGEFITHDYNLCFLKKYCIIPKLKEIEPTPSYKGFWSAMFGLVKLFVAQRQGRDNSGVLGNRLDEPGIDEMVRQVMKTLTGVPILPGDVSRVDRSGQASCLQGTHRARHCRYVHERRLWFVLSDSPLR